MMTFGNYGQQERNNWRYQYASKAMQLAWDELFHMSANKGFENTKKILIALLSSNTSFDNGILDSIISNYIAECENNSIYPWTYYYVKYSVFRPGRLRQFPLNRIVLLYAITVYLQHQQDVLYDDFVRRIRIVNNLIQNSEDEVSDRLDRNRIPAILQAVDAIILTGRPFPN